MAKRWIGKQELIRLWAKRKRDFFVRYRRADQMGFENGWLF